MTKPTSCRIERTVEWADTDAAGHQHNSVILRWAEACEAEMFRTLGLPEYFPSAPRVQQCVNYTAKLWFGQRTTTTVTVEKIGRTSMRFSFEVHGHPFEGRPCGLAAYGTFVTVHVHPNEAESRPWPQAYRDKITPAAAVQTAAV